MGEERSDAHAEPNIKKADSGNYRQENSGVQPPNGIMLTAPKVKQTAVKGDLKPVEGFSSLKQGKPPIKRYTYLKLNRNPDYEGGLRRLDRVYGTDAEGSGGVGGESPPLNLVYKAISRTKSEGKKPTEIWVKTQPKWTTDLLAWQVDELTGEAIPTEVYQTNDFKKSNGKKIKSLDAFCGYYQPLYRKRKVTLLFFTFTRANYARLEWKQMMDVVVEYLKRLGLERRGYVWTSEISEDLHYHFHLCVAIDRVKWKTIPPSLKFETIWGQRTEIDFVKKNIRHYMAKYFAKCDPRAIGKRSYGKSKKFL